MVTGNTRRSKAATRRNSAEADRREPKARHRIPGWRAFGLPAVFLVTTAQWQAPAETPPRNRSPRHTAVRPVRVPRLPALPDPRPTRCLPELDEHGDLRNRSSGAGSLRGGAWGDEFPAQRRGRPIAEPRRNRAALVRQVAVRWQWGSVCGVEVMWQVGGGCCWRSVWRR